MLSPSEKAVLSALCYSDVFDYPLNETEIQRFSTKRNIKNIHKILQCLNDIIFYKDGLFCLKGREKIITLRKKREVISKEKMVIAQKIISILRYIPTIELIAISGSLAMSNADLDHDIDFFMITKAGTIWFTRLIVLCVLQFFGLRRSRNEPSPSNKICVNMIIDERKLLLPKYKQNIFIAHEITQMKPIFVRNNSYRQFLQENIWVKKYLPHALSFPAVSASVKHIALSYKVPEFIAKSIQVLYMKKAKTREVITDTLLAFHPRDAQVQVMKNYSDKLKMYNI